MLKRFFQSRPPVVDSSIDTVPMAPNEQDFPASNVANTQAAKLVDTLRLSGRLICKVMSQVLKRASYDGSEFQIAVEFDNRIIPTYRVRVDMPAGSALEFLACKETEHTTKIELEMRYRIQVSTVYWRIEDADSKSLPLSGFTDAMPTQPMDLHDIAMTSHQKHPRKSYPAPVRVLTAENDGTVILGGDREATPSEINEFHMVLAEASESAHQSLLPSK